jgi:MFS family permease
LVDLRLLRIPTFRVATIGGTLFRVGGGALPFLLPLMFQIGFGLSAFQSGMMTFATGIGAMLMKFIAQPILRRFGFRRVLVVNAALAALMLLAPAGFTPQTPYLLMIATLFVGGICRSLQFTAINAIAYSDVEPPQMGSATSFNSVLQQLSASMGITLAAFGLEAMQGIYGGAAIDIDHFPAVFAMLALVSVSSTIWFWRLTPTAGASVLARDPARA